MSNIEAPTANEKVESKVTKDNGSDGANRMLEEVQAERRGPQSAGGRSNVEDGKKDYQESAPAEEKGAKETADQAKRTDTTQGRKGEKLNAKDLPPGTQGNGGSAADTMEGRLGEKINPKDMPPGIRGGGGQGAVDKAVRKQETDQAVLKKYVPALKLIH